MSSHHFVIEGQEPALFILDGLPFEQVASLLEWSPLVVVADRAIDEVLSWGIKIDVVLQKNYTLETLEEMLTDQAPIKIVSCGAVSSLEMGLGFLAENLQKAVNLIVHSDADFFESAKRFCHQIQLVVINEHQKWAAVTSGKFEKWMNEGARVVVHQYAEHPIRVEGLSKTDSVWTVSRSGLVTIETNPFFWVGELI
jgi:hypothetical protein